MRFKYILKSLGLYMLKWTLSKYVCGSPVLYQYFLLLGPLLKPPDSLRLCPPPPPLQNKKVVYGSTKDYFCTEQSLKIVLGLYLLYISLKISKNVFIHALLHVYKKNYIITIVSLASFNYLLYNVYCLMDVPFVDELYYQSDGHIWD